ncbi:MAG: ABC transporter ATP-binding protein, partial [Pseudomonadota bacterium]
MIRQLIQVAGTDHRPDMKRLVAGLMAEGVLIGLCLVSLLPFLSALMAEDYPAALLWWGVLAGVLSVYGIVRVKTQLLGYVTSIALGRALYARLGAHIAKLPLGWFNEQRTGELAVMSSRGVIEILSGVAHLLRPVVVMSTAPLVILIAIALADWQLALSVAVAVPFSVLASRWTKRLTSRADARFHAASVETAARIVEFAQFQPVLRAFARGETAASDLEAAFVEQRAAGRAQLGTVVGGLLAVTVVIQAALTLLLILGVNRALGGSIDVPELAALLVLGLRFAEPLLGAADLQSAMAMSEETLGRMQTLLDERPLPEPATPKHPKSHEIVLEDVHFDYIGAPVLTGVSFTAPAQGLTALVGPSGAGKTTILRLIARFFDVSSGRVRVGGVDVREMSGDALLR